MSTDNVVPIRDLHEEIADLSERIDNVEGQLPCDDLEPGYRSSASTQVSLCRVVTLLREALQLLIQARDREEPIYAAYYKTRHPDEAHR